MPSFEVEVPKTATIAQVLSVTKLLARDANVVPANLATMTIGISFEDTAGGSSDEALEVPGALADMLVEELENVDVRGPVIRHALARAWDRHERRRKLAFVLKQAGWPVPVGLEP